MTMTNAEWCIKNKIEFYRLHVNRLVDVNEFEITIDNKTISEIHVFDSSETDAILAWLDMEHKEQILDEIEKRYLSAVIKPFRKNVVAITKKTACSDGAREYIVISVHGSTIIFPDFNKNTMYKGMKMGKAYTLEELGL